MSESIEDDDDDRLQDGHVNGGTISDEDVRAMLAQEREKSRQLKAELLTERSGRNRAEATATTHQSARLDAERQAVAARLNAADSTAAGLRKELAEAMAEGRFDEVAELQDKMAELRAKQIDDKRYDAWLEAERTRAAAPVQRDEGVDLSQYSAAQRGWIRKHPEFMDDPKVRMKTFAGHQLAMADNVKVDTPEYFKIIDETVYGRQADDDEEEAPRPRRREPPVVDMPVSRGSERAERTRSVKLSADEMEAADIALPEFAVQGHRDNAGNWVPGRYERYAIQRQKLKERGR